MKHKTIEIAVGIRKEANFEFLARRAKRLFDNKAALAELYSWRLTEETVKGFYFGLSEEYVDSKKILHADALIAPVIDALGKPTNKSAYFNLPNITVNPATEDYWTRGEPQTYHSTACNDQKDIFVCSELREVWFLRQLLGKTSREPEILFVASTHPEHLPGEWYQNDFWRRFENVYLAHSNDAAGDKLALKIAPLTGQSPKRVRLPKDKGDGWVSFCQNSRVNPEEFNQFLSDAKIIGARIGPESNDLAPGRFGYQPVDIAGTFHNGHLYYPVRTLNNTMDKYRDEYGNPISQVSSRLEVVLIRSDRSEQTVCEVPAPRGTPLDERVLKISDGTLIESRPKVSIHSTWSWNSIKRFIKGQSRTRRLNAILKDVKDHLKQSIWLPLEHDYDLLTLLVPVTFAQAIFQAVPLILVTGPPGSGKSALGKAMVKICNNASTVGQISAAAIARLIDETKGFVVFDDLESIGKRKGREASHFSELVQSLKLSYNRETSWKTWTDVSRGMSVKRLNFYGVKMINNTTGTDDILGSRVLKIYTRKIPNHLQDVLGMTDAWDIIELNKLRDELHTWTFENVNLIDQTYQRLFPVSTDRTSEIFAPLRVFAELANDAELQSGLARALEFQSAVLDDSIDPVGMMKEAVKRLVIEGYTEISSTQIVLEMEKLISNKPFLYSDEDAGWRSPGWIGRQLRTQQMVEVNSLPSRQFFSGKYLRVYPLTKDYLDKTLAGNKTNAAVKTSGI